MKKDAGPSALFIACLGD